MRNQIYPRKKAGIVILNFEDYIKVCHDHLLSSILNQNSEEEQAMYYKAVDEFALDIARNKIKGVIEEAFENKIITKEEFSAMSPDDKGAAKFYCNLKVHKQKDHKELPPVRPIISGSGSVTENIS